MLILFAKIWSQNVATVEEDIVESHTSGVPPLVPRRPSTQHPPALAYFEGTKDFENIALSLFRIIVFDIN